MKKFIIKFIKLSLFFLIILCGIIGARYIYTTQLFSWKLPKEKHILFMGASHIEHGIDDTLTESGYNFAKSSERYLFTYLKLTHLLETNPQIDTIFLECAPTDLWEHTDDKYFNKNEMSLYPSLYYPLFNKEEWTIYNNNTREFIITILQQCLKNYFWGQNRYWHALGGKKENNTKQMDATKVHPQLEKGSHGHKINYKYLRKIINICTRHDIKLYLVYCPVYKPEYYYDQIYYYNMYKKNFSDVELLDYSNWPVNDNERYDAHHLNNEGAIKFTNELKKKFRIK